MRGPIGDEIAMQASPYSGWWKQCESEVNAFSKALFVKTRMIDLLAGACAFIKIITH